MGRWRDQASNCNHKHGFDINSLPKRYVSFKNGFCLIFFSCEQDIAAFPPHRSICVVKQIQMKWNCYYFAKCHAFYSPHLSPPIVRIPSKCRCHPSATSVAFRTFLKCKTLIIRILQFACPHVRIPTNVVFHRVYSSSKFLFHCLCDKWRKF